jgi:hypothetical protein
MFFFLGFVAHIPMEGLLMYVVVSRLHLLQSAYLEKFSTLVIQGLGFNTLKTALLGIPQGAFVVIRIAGGALIDDHLPKNSRTIVCALFMLPTISGGLGFLLGPDDANVGLLICL